MYVLDIRLPMGEDNGVNYRIEAATVITATCAFLTILAGVVVFQRALYRVVPGFLMLGYATIAITISYQLRLTKDVFNPLLMLLSLALVRFGLPFLLLYIGAPLTDPAQQRISLLGLSGADVIRGHILWVTAANSMILGWSIYPDRIDYHDSEFSFSVPDYTLTIASVVFLLGTISLATFIYLNAPFVQVLITGSFRGVKITEGTGVFWHFGLSTIAALAILGSAIINRFGQWGYLGVIPGITGLLLFWVFGGRSRSITPVAICVILVWYWYVDRHGWPERPVLHLFGFGMLFPGLMWFLHFSNLYQRGFGLNAISHSITSFPDYVFDSVYAGIGNFHGISGAVAVGPGSLGGNTFGVILYPLTEVLPVGKSTGVYIVETLVGTDTWGVGPSLIGDAYVNFGLAGTVFILGLFGVAVGIMYDRFRTGKLRPALYAIFIVYAVRILFEAINKWAELVTIAGFEVTILASAVILSMIATGTED